MAAFFKFEQFVEDLALGVHNLNTGVLKVYLSNAAPSASADAVKTDLAEIAGGNGYTAGGHDAQGVVSETAGVMSLSGTDIVITAAGGAIGPFRYAVLYNDTPTSPADPLIGCWDYGQSTTLNDGESVTVDFGSTILTLT